MIRPIAPALEDVFVALTGKHAQGGHHESVLECADWSALFGKRQNGDESPHSKIRTRMKSFPLNKSRLARRSSPSSEYECGSCWYGRGRRARRDPQDTGFRLFYPDMPDSGA